MTMEKSISLNYDRRYYSRQPSFGHHHQQQQLYEPHTPPPISIDSYAHNKPFLLRSVTSIDIPPPPPHSDPAPDALLQDQPNFSVISLLHILRSGNNKPMNKLFLMISLNFAYSTFELLLGLFTGRIGLVSDAFHLTFGCGLLTFSLFAMAASRSNPDPLYTYGFKRLEVLSAFTNALVSGWFYLRVLFVPEECLIVPFPSLWAHLSPFLPTDFHISLCGQLFLLFMSFSLAVEALHAFIQDESEHKHYLIVSATTNLLVNLIGVWFFRNYARINLGDSTVNSLKSYLLLFNPATPSLGVIPDVSDHYAQSYSLVHVVNCGPRAYGSPLGILFSSPCNSIVAYRKAEDMNYHSVCLHVLADSIRSAGLILASWFLALGVQNAEVLCLGIVSITIFTLVMPLFKTTGGILLQMAPLSIPSSALSKCMRQIISQEDVVEVSQIRFWEFVPSHVVGSLSVKVKSGINDNQVLHFVHDLYHDLGIHEVTVQIDNV